MTRDEIFKAIRADLRQAAAALRRVQTRLYMSEPDRGPLSLAADVQATQQAVRALMTKAGKPNG